MRAQRLAEDHNHQEIEPAHLLYALLEEREGVVNAVVTKIAGSTEKLRQEIWSGSGKTTPGSRRQHPGGFE